MGLCTIKDLMKEIGCMRKSVSYGEKRAVLNHLDTEVVAYAIGYAGFVGIVPNSRSFQIAFCYSAKHIESGYPEGGFTIKSTDEVLTMIREGKLWSRTEIDEVALKLIKDKEDYVRPEIGFVTIKKRSIERDWGMSNSSKEVLTTESREERYRVTQFKNKSYCVETMNNWRKTWVREFYTDFAKMFASALNNDGTQKLVNKGDVVLEIVENTIPEEHKERMLLIAMERSI